MLTINEKKKNKNNLNHDENSLDLEDEEHA